ncbi:MAG: hypothetical protein JWQ27_2897 [Ferruginibacter sp.]|nr:hypothetical protein [Ferruginibacter sp.]
MTTICRLATLALLLSVSNSYGQDSTKILKKGDVNVSATGSSRTNVPKNQRNQNVPSKYRPQDPIGNDQPDVLLDIPNLSVDEIGLEVDNLKANLSLDARVANLVQLKAGVDLGIDRVKITIKGVQASVLLIVRLDNVREIISQTLETLDKNPQIVDKLLSTVDNAVNTVGSVANTALQPGGVISQTVNSLGQTVSRTIDAAGNIVEKTVDATGKAISSNTVGKLLDLPVVSQTTNAAGQVVKKVTDNSGKVLELVIDKSGKLVSTSVVK